MKSVKEMLNSAFTAAAWRKIGLASAIAGAACFGSLATLGVMEAQKQKEDLADQQAWQTATALAQAAREKNREQSLLLENLALSLKQQDYEGVVSFLQNPPQILDDTYYALQNHQIIEESALRQENGPAILLDLTAGSFYLGEVDDNGLRQGQGIQFGYTPTYKSVNENGQAIYYPMGTVYKGNFENNLAQGQGSYELLPCIYTDKASRIHVQGTFAKGQMDGTMTFSWQENGKAYEDSVEVEQGTFVNVRKWKNEYIYAGSWDFLSYRRLSVFDESMLKNTSLFHTYLAHYAADSVLETKMDQSVDL